MCGITGYLGKKEALPIVFNNLRKLEYRGYDSAGVAYFDQALADGQKSPDLKVIRAVGKLDHLEHALKGTRSLKATAAIAHTRWATHGVPNELNAHPHGDCKNEIFVVHNGIVENYQELKEDLKKKGHQFLSQTDTEIIAHLIEEYGFEPALKKIIGAYALAVVYKSNPQKIHFARLGSPLVVGVGRGEYYIASDPTALAGQVKKVIFLKEGQQGVISLHGFKVGPARHKIERLEINPEQAKKGSFPHFMLKEIFEGPEVVQSALRGRLLLAKGKVKLGGLEMVQNRLKNIKRLEIISCGTSYYAGMVGQLLFEELANLPTEVVLASEYRYRKEPVQKGTASLFVSQSGETADTLAALRKSAAHKNLLLGIVNVVGSSIARETEAGVYNHAGPEISVASTKAFLSQLTVLTLMSLYLSPLRKLNKQIIKELSAVPEKIRLILNESGKIKLLAEKYLKYKNFFYLGRGYNYPVALEGALKLKEISYLHAEGYAGGEMKHGPIALIDPGFATVAVVTKNSIYEKMISNLEEIKARGGPILAVASEGDQRIAQLADDVIVVPKSLEHLEPFLNVVPLQLFAYYLGALKGHDVDKPRNLAKSVTVE